MSPANRNPIEQVYLIRWPDGITKIGYTAGKRWRHFELRGARIIRIWRFATWSQALECETQMQRAMPFAPAWQCAEEVDERLGTRPGGWRECYRVPTSVSDQAVLAMLTSIASEHCSVSIHGHMHGRTRTD